MERKQGCEKKRNMRNGRKCHRNLVLCACRLGRVRARVAFFILVSGVAPRPGSDEWPRHRRMRGAVWTPGIGGVDDGRSPRSRRGAENDRRVMDGGGVLDADWRADEGGAQRRQVAGQVGSSSWRDDEHHIGLEAGRVDRELRQLRRRHGCKF